MALDVEAGSRTNSAEFAMSKSSNAGASVDANSVAQRRGQSSLHSAQPHPPRPTSSGDVRLSKEISQQGMPSDQQEPTEKERNQFGQ